MMYSVLPSLRCLRGTSNVLDVCMCIVHLSLCPFVFAACVTQPTDSWRYVVRVCVRTHTQRPLCGVEVIACGIVWLS